MGGHIRIRSQHEPNRGLIFPHSTNIQINHTKQPTEITFFFSQEPIPQLKGRELGYELAMEPKWITP